MKQYFFFLLSLTFLNGFSQTKSIDKITALVNDEIILESDLNYYRQKAIDSSSNDCVVLEKLIIDKLLYSKAVKDSIELKEEEVDAEIENRMNYFIQMFGSQEKLEKYYNKTVNEIKIYFRDEIKQKMLSDRARNKLLAGMSPSPKDVKDYFNNLSKDSIPHYNAEIQLSQIVFVPKVTREAKRQMRNKAEKIRGELLRKESQFSTQALLYSDDGGSAANGGELGWVRHGEMVPEFEQAAFSLPTGQVSDIIETKFGLHIIEVLEKKADKNKVRHILISAKADPQGIVEAKSLADSIRLLILSKKLSFEKAVEIYSDDVMYKSNGGILVNMKNRTRSTLFEMNDIDPTLTDIISHMKPGDISIPQAYQTADRKVGYRIVKMISESAPHKASLETDYYKIKDIVTDKMKDKAMTNWLKFYKNYVFVKIDNKYTQCPQLQLFNKSNP